MENIKNSKKVKRTKRSSRKSIWKKGFPNKENKKYIDPGAVKAQRENQIFLMLTGRDDEGDW